MGVDLLNPNFSSIINILYRLNGVVRISLIIVIMLKNIRPVNIGEYSKERTNWSRVLNNPKQMTANINKRLNVELICSNLELVRV